MSAAHTEMMFAYTDSKKEEFALEQLFGTLLGKNDFNAAASLFSKVILLCFNTQFHLTAVTVKLLFGLILKLLIT